MIDFCAKQKYPELCELILSYMKKFQIQPSIVTYNTIIDAYMKN